MLDTNLGVVGRSLVRVFPVTQSRDPLVSDSTTLREAFGHPFDPLTEPVRDRRVVFGGPPVLLRRIQARGRQSRTRSSSRRPAASRVLRYLSVLWPPSRWRHRRRSP